MDGLSERERNRLAEIIKAPLVPPAHPSRNSTTIRWPKWDAIRLATAKNHIRTHRRAWTTGAATAIGCLLFLAIAVSLTGRHSVDPLKLQVRESQGQLRILWDAESELVRRATDAQLFITDGTQRLSVKLSNRRLQRGVVSYVRQTGRVELRMALSEPDGKTVERQAIFYGAPVPEEEPPPQLSAAASAAAAPPITAAVNPDKEESTIEHRSRRKPLVQSGTSLPFTCATGDVFHKTDAPAGWDTFTCKGRNVWSIAPAQTSEDRAIQPASATTVITKPASAPTT